MEVFSNSLYKVVVKENPSPSANYEVVNRRTACVEAEIVALPNAVEAAILLEEKYEQLMEHVSEGEPPEGQVVKFKPKKGLH